MPAPGQKREQYPYRVTMALRKAFSLYDTPTTIFQKFIGYFRHADKTTLPDNTLTYPSQNCFIPMKDKIVPRLGSTLLGAAYTANKNWPIIGHKKLYITAGGFSTEVRVTQSNDYNQNDIIEIFYPNPLTGVSQWYKISYYVWGLVPSTYSNWSSVFPGVHRYYMDDWFDTNVNPSKSFNIPRLIWTNGNPFIYSWSGGIAPIIDIYQSGTSYYLTTSYGSMVYAPLSGTAWIRGELVTGGTSGANAFVASTAVVNSFSVMKLIHVNGTFVYNESITGGTSGAVATVTSFTPPPTTWASLGFIDNASSGENSQIVINGTLFVVSTSFNTNSWLLASGTPPGINVGDVAFTVPRADKTSAPIDVCRNNQNYMFYGNSNSRNYYMANAFGHDSVQTVSSSNALLNNLVVSGTYTGSGSHTYKVLITTAGAPDQFQWQIDGATPIATGVSVTGSAQTLSNGISVTFGTTTGHLVGDYWLITVNQAVNSTTVPAWANFYYSTPARLPGEGYIYQLPSNFWAMEPQESQMYVNTQYGEWGYIETKLASNLLTESVVYTPLKQTSSSKVLYPYLIGHLDNSLIYISNNKKLDQISRQKFLELPQIGNLSNLVQLDFDELSFTNGSVEYWDKKFWMTSPIEGKMLCYDTLQKYWQPPQVIPQNGILSVVGNSLISHSNLLNQSFTLFNSIQNGDNGSAYTVVARTAYDSSGNRWGKKFSNTSFIEGYVDNAPDMYMNIYIDINGSSGIRSHLVKPVIDATPTTAPLGQGALGEHPLGSDVFDINTHFFEIDKSSIPISMQWRFLAMEMAVTALRHSYVWLTMGVNHAVDSAGNNELINKPTISTN